MTPTEIPTFIAAVTQVFEALGHKPPTQLALQAWVQTIKEFAFSDIVPVLDGWLKRSTKPPAPADVWKVLNDQRTERIERTVVAEKGQFEREANHTFQRSDKLGKALRQLAAELRDAQPRDPKEWAHTLWHRFVADRPNPDGSAMSEMQIEMACRALGRTRQGAIEARGNYRSARAAMVAA